MNIGDDVIGGFLDAFSAQKTLADKAIVQISDEQLRRPLHAETNSVAVIMKHMSGNFMSRFTDFLTTDGEKPWRSRDEEFVDRFRDRAEILSLWESGWGVLMNTVGQLEPQHLEWMVTIRGQSMSVPAALARSLAHTGYHVGQIVMISRIVCDQQWNTITIARGRSQQYNTQIGYGLDGSFSGQV